MPSFDFDRGKPWQEIYEHGLVPAIFGPWSTRTLALAVPKEGENVLDIACGTGVVTRLAARSVGTRGKVIGLDVDPGMIEVARVLPVPKGTSIWQLHISDLFAVRDLTLRELCQLVRRERHTCRTVNKSQ